MARRAYSYVRFSTPEQAEGDSFRRQTEFSRKYAEAHDLVLDDSLSLRDLGVSAFRGSNVREGALAGFLAAVKTQKVPAGSVLIVESLDRLSRDQVRTALRMFMDILDHGVSIVTTKPEREYSPKDNDPLALIEPLIYFSRANEESQTKSSRIADSWDVRRRSAAAEKKPMTPVGPKWLRLDADTGKFEFIPDRARLVKRIFRMSREGMGTYAIAKALTDEGVKSFGRDSEKGIAKPGAWNTAYVRLILTDRRAVGEYQPKKLVNGKMVPVGDPIRDYFPAVVTEQEFYVSAGSIKSRVMRGGRGGADHENLFTGIVFNAEDGSKMYFATDKKGNGVIESAAGYYGGKAPRGRSFRYRPFEAAVLSVIAGLKPADLDGSVSASKIAEEKMGVSGRLTELDEKLKKIYSRQDSTGDYDTFLDLVTKLKGEQKSLSARLEALKAQEAAGSAEDLGETGSIIKARLYSRGDERARLNRSLKGKIKQLVSEVWVLVEVVTRNKKFAHTQIFFASGESRYCYAEFPPPKPESSPVPRNYSGVDLRTLRTSGKM